MLETTEISTPILEKSNPTEDHCVLTPAVLRESEGQRSIALKTSAPESFYSRRLSAPSRQNREELPILSFPLLLSGGRGHWSV